MNLLKEFMPYIAAIITSTISGVCSYLKSKRDFKNQVETIEMNNKHEIDKLMEQHKVDIENLKEKHKLEMEAKEKDHEHEKENNRRHKGKRIYSSIHIRNNKKIDEEQEENNCRYNSCYSIYSFVLFNDFILQVF